MLKACIDDQRETLEPKGVHWVKDSCFHDNPPSIFSGWNEAQAQQHLGTLSPTLHSYMKGEAVRTGYKGPLYRTVVRYYRSYAVKGMNIPTDGACLSDAVISEKRATSTKALKTLIIGE